MTVGKICQFFYLAKVLPLLQFFPPPSRSSPPLGSDFSAGLPILKVFIFGEADRARPATARFSKCKGGGQQFPEYLLIPSGARETTHPVSEVSSHA